MTPRLKQLLDFLVAFEKTNGYCASYVEMAAGINIRSKSGICRMMGELEERGFVTRIAGRQRSVIVVRAGL